MGGFSAVARWTQGCRPGALRRVALRRRGGTVQQSGWERRGRRTRGGLWRRRRARRQVL